MTLDALKTAYNVRSTLGEQITFRGSALQVPVINRSPDTRTRRLWDFSDDISSVAELPLELSPNPAGVLGESFMDSIAKSHRIVEVRNNGICYIVGCVVSAA